MTDPLLDDLKRALGDAYTIERELTGGGMSRVFVAREHALGREVVIKVLPPELAAGVNRERFRREVQLAARLSHPYIVPLLHAGEAGELLWFTMPFIPGESLRTRLEQHGPLKVRETIQLLRDVVEALAYAHSRGVIHRDIKPGNILSDGQHAVVTDFGVAKALFAALPASVAGHTTSGMAIGTPAYMAPEQLAADPAADHRVDIYATGLLAYELLTGESPFSAASPTATMTAQLTRTPDPLHTRRKDVPTGLSQLVARCLAKDADDRPADAQAVLVELDRISGALAADAHRSTSGETAAVRKRWGTLPLLIGSAAMAAAIGGGAWLAKGTTPPAGPPAVETVAVRSGADQPASVPLAPPKLMTREDSLRIAAALRNELDKLMGNTGPLRMQVVETTVVTVPLAVELANVDSMVRERMAELTRGRVTVGGAFSTTARPAISSAPPSPGTVMMGPMPPITPAAPRKVLIVPSTSRRVDPALAEVNTLAVRELARRLADGGRWEVMVQEDGDRIGNERGLQGNPDALAMVQMVQVGKDSAEFRINVRNTMAGSQYGFNLASSKVIPRPTSVDPLRGTIGFAVRLLEDLRRVRSGESWAQDMGREFQMMRGGDRFAPGSRGDSMLRRADSITKANLGRRPGGGEGGNQP